MRRMQSVCSWWIQSLRSDWIMGVLPLLRFDDIVERGRSFQRQGQVGERSSLSTPLGLYHILEPFLCLSALWTPRGTRSILTHGPANMTFCFADGPETVLTYIYLQLTHFMNTVILRSPSGPGPRLHFEQCKQRQETANMATEADGRLTQKRSIVRCQNYFYCTSCSFSTSY